MSDNQISTGDVVRLKSGGPAMTVKEVFPGAKENTYQSVCTWFNSRDEYYSVYKEASFPLTSLSHLSSTGNESEYGDNSSDEKVILF